MATTVMKNRSHEGHDGHLVRTASGTVVFFGNYLVFLANAW